ncbi:MAG: MFS transporter [Euryarchaeota archaeon]|nr:MFS transporter [Euryarchaeota archaeon]
MTRSAAAPAWRAVLNRVVIVSALGYFVDIYDLLIFAIVSVPSLQALGYTSTAEIRVVTGDLLGIQMLGLLAGGFLWGILGDKKGRLSVLFGSIALYSVANIANAFVVEISGATGLSAFSTYATLRFVSGVGLAGELGAAVTLVSEVMTKALRGYGTAVVAGVGILGALAGGAVALTFDWKAAYLVGGVLGLALLVTRITLAESGMFRSLEERSVSRGNVLMLFTGGRFGKFARTTLVGLPIWCIIGIFVSLSPFIAPGLGVTGRVSQIYAVMFCYAGAAMGGLGWGVLSQRFETRREVLFAAIAGLSVVMFGYFFLRGLSPGAFYVVCGLLGLMAGYWSVFVTAAAEQFGTNLRATVATIVPNVIRGSTFPLAWVFNRVLVGRIGEARSALVLGTVCILIALWALRGLPETFGKDLDYFEGTTADAPAASPKARRAPAAGGGQ